MARPEEMLRAELQRALQKGEWMQALGALRRAGGEAQRRAQAQAAHAKLQPRRAQQPDPGADARRLAAQRRGLSPGEVPPASQTAWIVVLLALFAALGWFLFR